MNGRATILTSVRVLALAAAVVVLLWPLAAAATPTFPGDVDADLMLTMRVETTFPTMGCRLCHLSESPPATNPPMKPFGSLLFQEYGVLPYDDASLKAGLADLARDHPDLVMDLEAGRDPNEDQNAPASLPTPEYGCAASARAVSHGDAWVAAMLAVMWLVRTVRTRERRD